MLSTNQHTYFFLSKLSFISCYCLVAIHWMHNIVIHITLTRNGESRPHHLVSNLSRNRLPLLYIILHVGFYRCLFIWGRFLILLIWLEFCVLLQLSWMNEVHHCFFCINGGCLEFSKLFGSVVGSFPLFFENFNW